MKTQKGDGIFDFHPHFNIRHIFEGRFISFTRRTHFTAKEIPWSSFLLETEWTPKLVN